MTLLIRFVSRWSFFAQPCVCPPQCRCTCYITAQSQGVRLISVRCICTGEHHRALIMNNSGVGLAMAVESPCRKVDSFLTKLFHPSVQLTQPCDISSNKDEPCVHKVLPCHLPVPQTHRSSPGLLSVNVSGSFSTKWWGSMGLIFFSCLPQMLRLLKGTFWDIQVCRVSHQGFESEYIINILHEQACECTHYLLCNIFIQLESNCEQYSPAMMPLDACDNVSSKLTFICSPLARHNETSQSGNSSTWEGLWHQNHNTHQHHLAGPNHVYSSVSLWIF